MEKKEKEIIINLIQREIDNFTDVFNRTKKDCWLEEIKNLELLKEKIKNNN
jgi:hypothetical protein